MKLLLYPLRLLAYLWASPLTLLGLFLGGLTLLTGGRAQVVRGVVEFWGGFGRWFLHRHPLVRNAAAMTIGHVIIGQTLVDLDCSRDHEHVHVKQFERWGLFMAPAYLGASLWLYLRGKDYYWDNPFEIEARRLAP
jgi:hypothetical protein